MQQYIKCTYVSNSAFLFIHEVVENKNNRYDLGFVQLNYQKMTSFWPVHVHSYPLSFIFQTSRLGIRNLKEGTVSSLVHPVHGAQLPVRILSSLASGNAHIFHLPEVHNSCH